MNVFNPSDDPLDRAILALEAAVSDDQASIAEIEGRLAQKKSDLWTLSVELSALQRAAGLRPVAMGGAVR